jgi:nucleoside-diphosphate-sugar epimerase
LVPYDEINLGAGYDAVVHMATAYGRNKENASDIMTANLLMPAKLLEQCLNHGVGIFINADTYYAAAGVGHNMAAYVLSKQHFNKWAKLIANANLKLVNMRIEHLYGPMDARNKFCTAIVQDCLMGKPRISLTEGDQLRDFIYVEDAASAYATVLDNIMDLPAGWSEVGVGCGHAIPLREFVILAHALTGSQSVLGFGDLAKANGEIPVSKADNTFLCARGWSCKTQLADGIRAVIKDL